MGAYLSTPCVEKKSEDSTNLEKFSFGVSGMQGWRISMEDAHNCVPDLDDDSSLFGVYDGHGGSEVANYCSLHFAKILKKSNLYQNGDYEEALKETFMNIDKSLMEPEVIRELKVLADRDPGDGPPTEVDYKTKDQEEEYDEDETKLLYEEATMSIEDLLARYGRAANEAKTVFNKMKEETIKETESVPAQTTTDTDHEPSNHNAEVTSASGRKSSTSLKAKPLESDQNSSMNGLKIVPESTKKSETDKVMSAEVSSSTSTNDTVNKVKSRIVESGEVTDNCSLETENAKGDSKENEAIIKESDVKEKLVGKVLISKIKQHSSTSKLLSDPEEEVNADEDSEDSDSEDGFDSDEAVEGSSDSDEEESEEEDDEEDEEEDVERIDISELKRANPMSNIEEPGKDSGTTAVIAFLKGHELYVANAGDSRCVLCRNGKAVDMSEDHKPEDDIEMKRIKAAGGHVNTQGRVNGGLNLSRAIGDHCYKTNTDIELKDQMISAMPDVKKVCLQPGDEFIVLACDGIWNVFSSQEVVDFIRARMPDAKDESFKLSSICEELFDMSLAPDAMGDGTGCDNMTCIIVGFNGTWLEKYPAPETETLSDSMTSDKEAESTNCNHAAGEVDNSSDPKGDLSDEVDRNNSSFDDVNCDGDDNLISIEKSSEKSNFAFKRQRQDDDADTNTNQQDQVENSTKRPKVA